MSIPGRTQLPGSGRIQNVPKWEQQMYRTAFVCPGYLAVSTVVGLGGLVCGNEDH